MNRHDAYPSEMVIIIFEELSILMIVLHFVVYNTIDATSHKKFHPPKY